MQDIVIRPHYYGGQNYHIVEGPSGWMLAYSAKGANQIAGNPEAVNWLPLETMPLPKKKKQKVKRVEKEMRPEIDSWRTVDFGLVGDYRGILHDLTEEDLERLEEGATVEL